MWECFTESYKNSQLTQYTHDVELDTWMSSADQMNFQARPKNRKKTQVLLQAGDEDKEGMTLKEYFESPTSKHDPIRDAKIRPNRAFTQLLNPDEEMSQASTAAGLSNLNSDGSALSGLGDDDTAEKSLLRKPSTSRCWKRRWPSCRPARARKSSSTSTRRRTSSALSRPPGLRLPCRLAVLP